MRDDLKKLPLPPEAKSYARRKGLAAMKKQPQSFINMVAAVTDQKDKKRGFKNTDEVGTVPKAIKEAARAIVTCLVEADGEPGFYEFKVYPDDEGVPTDNQVTYNVEVPYGTGKFVNKILIPAPFSTAGISAVEQRMRHLAGSRTYPPGSFFVAPWGTYLIHGGTVGRIE